MSKFHDEQENLREEEAQDQGSRIATEISIKNKTKQFDDQVARLAEEAVKCTLEYGEDHYMTEMMVMFLEMALAMKEAIKQVTMSQVAISTIQRAMGVVQESLRFNDEVMSDLLSVDMGFMARFRRKRKMRKSIRNMRNSIVMTFNEVMGFSKLAQEISEELQDAMERMQASNRRAKRRRQKRQERAEKRGKNGGEPLGPSPARKLIEETMAKMRAEGKLPDSAASDGASAGGTVGGGVSGPSKDLKSKGVKDIDDIA